jgi:hypothetical protein
VEFGDRRVLSTRRLSETFELRHGAHNAVFSVSLGFYEDGTIGEVFVTGAKAGSDVAALCSDAATLLSIALQHGVKPELLAHTVQREADAAPSTNGTNHGNVLGQNMLEPGVRHGTAKRWGTTRGIRCVDGSQAMPSRLSPSPSTAAERVPAVPCP